MIYGAILAGGIGKRVERYSIPKQFVSIGGNPIIVMSIRKFLENRRIPIIYVAVHKDWIMYAENLFKENFSSEELLKIRVVCGGEERIDSFVNIMNDIVSRTGLNEEDVLICHDSVRPFVQQQMIEDCIDATLQYKLALTVVPVTDTIHVADESEYINGTLNREHLYNGQTPSGFNLACLYQAYKKFGDEDKRKITGTTQMMIKLGHTIKIVNGHTSNFKITTDNDLDVAERMVRATKRKRAVTMLDCTLRDGGIVVDFDFGTDRVQKIKSCLEKSGVEYIECGYINEKNGKEKGYTCYIDEKAIESDFLFTGKKDGVTYVAMIDYGTFDVCKLQNCSEQGIDGIRLAFHKEQWKEAIVCGKTIIEKGYQLYIQPMVTTRYTDEEFRELIIKCNEMLPAASAFYLVDSFGQMDNVTLLHKLEIADQYVSPTMKIGLHAHNNRQTAFSNACTFVNYTGEHELMVDSCIMGMGKGAGNLCTELMMPVLIAEGNGYSTVSLYEEIGAYFSHIVKEKSWGYCLDYYLSSLYGCTPSYIKLFSQDERVTTDTLIHLLEKMPEDKKAACDRKFAVEYLNEYFEIR